jgi:hypothetical protein
MTAIGKRVATLLGLLDALSDGEGTTLLDNSIVYWSMQYGAVSFDTHAPYDMAAFVAGKGGGRLKTGHFVNYRLEGGNRGVPLNNLLVTIMNCFGLSSSDYESAPGNGYGYYKALPADHATTIADGPYWRSTAGRHAPLPFIYTGPTLG